MTILTPTEEKNFAYTILTIKIVSLFCGIVMLILSKYAFIFFMLAMIPTIISLFFDRSKGKYISTIICIFNLISLMPFLRDVWQSSDISLTSREMIATSTVWITIYGAVVIGQMIYLVFPWVFCYIYIIKCQFLTQKLIKQKENICIEWDIVSHDFEKNIFL